MTVWLLIIVTLSLAGPISWLISMLNASETNEQMTLQKCYNVTYKIFVQQGKNN
jgi:hypothetical protein